MKKAFEYIYYCIYRVLYSIIGFRVGEKKLASDLYFLPLVFNTYMIIFILLGIFPLNIYVSYLCSMLVSILIFLGWKIYCKNYFIKQNHSDRIINYYQSKISNKKALLISISYYILSFVGFVISAKYCN